MGGAVSCSISSLLASVAPAIITTGKGSRIEGERPIEFALVGRGEERERGVQCTKVSRKGSSPLLAFPLLPLSLSFHCVSRDNSPSGMGFDKVNRRSDVPIIQLRNWTNDHKILPHRFYKFNCQISFRLPPPCNHGAAAAAFTTSSPAPLVSSGGGKGRIGDGGRRKPRRGKERRSAGLAWSDRFALIY